MQRLIIKNFGPIEELDIEVKDFMVFVGPQASGKSTVAKLVYFFKKLRDELINDFLRHSPMDSSQLTQHLKEDARIEFQKIWGHDIQPGNGFVEFQYSAGLSITLTPRYDHRFDLVSFSFSDGFTKIIEEAREDLNKVLEVIESKKEPNSSILERLESDWAIAVKERFNSIFGDDRDLVFVPAVRFFQTPLDRTSTEELLSKDFSLLVRFIKPMFVGSLTDTVLGLERQNGSNPQKKQSEKAVQIVEEVLGGQYRFEKDNEHIKLKGGQKIALSQTSSGQQESLWMLYLLIYFIANRRKVLIIIEEPEAHLYPNAQSSIVDLISIFFNVGDRQNAALVTTHSPYILGSINTHLLAGSIGPKNPEATSKITPDWIDSKRAGAWLLQNGTATSIIDDELKIIQNEVIDGISGTINEAFDRLIDIKFG